MSRIVITNTDKPSLKEPTVTRWQHEPMPQLRWSLGGLPLSGKHRQPSGIPADAVMHGESGRWRT